MTQPAAGQEFVPAGNEFQINTFTTNSQSGSSVSLADGGGFVVVWTSIIPSGPDSYYAIRGQRFASSGTPLGNEFQVNTFTSTSPYRFLGSPSISLDADGDFVVVWSSFFDLTGTDSSGQSIQAQRFASDGTPLGTQFQVNTGTFGYQYLPSVSADADGDFVVVWTSFVSAGTDSSSYSVQGQRYASDGTPLGSEFQINTFTTGEQRDPSVSMAADGDFVVVWSSAGSSGTDSSSFSVQGQRFAPNGLAIGSEFQINTYTTGSQRPPWVSVDAVGGFVVAWSSEGSNGADSYRSVQARRYASDGSPLGDEFQVNDFTTGFQGIGSVALDADGDFVVAWSSMGSSGTDSSSFSVQGRRYASDGTPVGNEFQVNTYTTGNQSAASVSMDAHGEFVVVWSSDGSSGTDSSSSSIQGQRYVTPIFADGFESGDTTEWSNAIPPPPSVGSRATP